MSREISNNNEYTDKLVKLIPTEIIGAYLATEGMVSTLPSVQHVVLVVNLYSSHCINSILFMVSFWRKK